ncbi:MAG: hypothetical protein WCE21_02465 [Candidatus Babeliales bacterium]
MHAFMYMVCMAWYCCAHAVKAPSLIPVGLGQCGNNCFQNAVLQMLWQIDDLRTILLTLDENKVPQDTLTYVTVRLCKQMDAVARANIQQYHGNAIRLDDTTLFTKHQYITCTPGKELDLFTQMGWNIIGQMRYTQQDASHFLNKFLDTLLPEVQQYLPEHYKTLVEACAFIFKTVAIMPNGEKKIRREVLINRPVHCFFDIKKDTPVLFDEQSIRTMTTPYTDKRPALVITNSTNALLRIDWIEHYHTSKERFNSVLVTPHAQYPLYTDLDNAYLSEKGMMVRIIWYSTSKKIEGRCIDVSIKNSETKQLVIKDQTTAQLDGVLQSSKQRAFFEHLEEVLEQRFVYADKRAFFVTNPSWLMIELGRGAETKLTNSISIPTVLNLQRYFDFKAQGKEGYFVLRAVVRHTGTLTSGHWFAYVSNGTFWYTCNDAQIEPVQSNFWDEQGKWFGEGTIYLYESAEHEKTRIDARNEKILEEMNAVKSDSLRLSLIRLKRALNQLALALEGK